jgi:ATP synthase protein I
VVEQRGHRNVSDQIGEKEQRKIKSRQEKDRGVWFGLGMFGLVGWAVAIPTLIGIALGVWIDKTVVTPYSWTLMGLFIGVILGCLNAWYWVNRESGRD